MSKSVWTLSGGYFARVTGTWAAFFGLIVLLPAAPDKQRPAASVAALKTLSASASGGPSIQVQTRGFDFGALPTSAFGDSDSAREQR